jgi:HAD superfamily hydrolase (TIGR01509 family)
LTTPLLIFDCDGVLVDSEYLFAQVASECLSGIGIGIAPQAAARRFAGVSIRDMLAELEHERGHPLPAGFEDLLVRREDEAYKQRLQSIPGVREAVLALELPRCVASSSLPERIAGSLVMTGLDDLFAEQARFSTTLVARGKPAPDIFLLAAERMGATPEGAIVIEDSVAGVTGAAAAGMRVIGFAGGRHCGEGHAARLKSAGADRVIAEMRLLPETVRALVSAPDRRSS